MKTESVPEAENMPSGAVIFFTPVNEDPEAAAADEALEFDRRTVRLCTAVLEGFDSLYRKRTRKLQKWEAVAKTEEFAAIAGHPYFHGQLAVFITEHPGLYKSFYNVLAEVYGFENITRSADMGSLAPVYKLYRRHTRKKSFRRR